MPKGKPKEKNGECRICKCSFLKNSNKHWYCDDCAKSMRLKRNVKYDRKRRKTTERKNWEKNWRETKGKEKKQIRDYSYHKFRQELLEEIGCCEICGSVFNLEIHHISYTKEKEAIKLFCKKCHTEVHKNEYNKKTK